MNILRKYRTALINAAGWSLVLVIATAILVTAFSG